MKKFVFLIIFLISLNVALAADNYKPYLHKANVPKAPEVKLYGQYHTDLFPGAATYSYQIDAPKGVNGLAPYVSIFYNSQRKSPSILGTGWFLNQDYIQRNVNGTPDNLNDDKFILVLDGNQYELVWTGSEYKTEVDYFFKIEKSTDSWVVTKPNGMKYRFGYNSDSKISSKKWFLDLVNDAHENLISYSYLQSPNAEDSNAVYLSTISYATRKIVFNYESTVRSDRRRIYDNSILLEESRRLSDVSIFVDNVLLKRNHFGFSTLSSASSSLSKISLVGNDNVSILYNISFGYYSSDFGYTNSTSIFRSPVIFSDNSHNDFGVRILDLNNDGYMDLIQKIGGGANKSWINDKNSNFTENVLYTSPVDIVTSGYVDEGVRFEDINNDGFTDLLKSKNSVRAVYLNTGFGWNLSIISIPNDFVDVSGIDLGVVFADVNNDGKIDIISGKDGVRNVYLGNGTGWVLSNWTLPVDFITSSKDSGARLIDLNGDGLPDLIQSSNLGSVVNLAWLNNGSGWVNTSTWIVPSGLYFTTTANPDNGVRFADLNGDGLVDILEDFANGTTTLRGAWLNTGNGWTSSSSWQSPETFTLNGYNMGRRLADLNGDGFADILVSQQDSNTQYTWIKNSTVPYLLKSITNEFGGITTINYTKSTQFNNTEFDLSKIGFNIYVVNSFSANNSLTNPFNALNLVNYNYSFGKYNYDKQEFRGFGKSTEIKSNSVVNHYFYQDSPRRGKEYKTEVLNLTGAMFSAQENIWNWTQQNGIYNLSMIYSTDYLYDGNTVPKITNTTYVYNCFGNYKTITKEGDPNDVTDDRVYEYTYAINPTPWILNKVASETVYDYLGNKIKETKYYYDDLGLTGISKGDLTKTENYLESGDNPTNYFSYDDFGNVISKTDARGNVEKYNYDDNHIYLNNFINALGHMTRFTYDSFGNKLTEEKNGIITSYVYDTFGRISKEILPYDSTNLPTKQYYYYFDGVAPESIKVSAKTTANNYDSTEFYYDGFSNLVQLKSNLEDTNLVKNIFYDSEFRVSSEQNPYFDSTSGFVNASVTANKTYYTYDATDRVTKVTNSDGSIKKVVFNQYNITDFDENGHKHRYELDYFGQIAKVVEYYDDPVTLSNNETFETTYNYDLSGNLIKITDSQGNVFSFTYDALGRKTAMNDPDMGNWSYSYDGNGNLISQKDNRNKIISLSYDLLNRVSVKSSDDVTTSFVYDLDYFGTLSKIIKNDVNISYAYDQRLRPIKETQDSEKTIVINYIYDAQNRLISEESFGSKLDYLFNKLGKVKQIPGFLNSASYNSFGSLTNKSYANGITTYFAYGGENNRLANIQSIGVQNLSYTYDSVGNILSINDAIDQRLSQMKYDSLDRLREAKINNDLYSYTYNSLGNIMSTNFNNISKKYIYGNLPHTPSQINDNLGADFYSAKELDTQSKNRTFEMFIVNNQSSNVSVDFGDNSQTTINLNDSGTIIAYVEHSYNSGGDYKVNLSSNSDRFSIKSKFGLIAESLNAIYHNVSTAIFEFTTKSTINEPVRNVTWNCSDGIQSYLGEDLGALQKQINYIVNNYTTAGVKRFSCTAISLDGVDTKSTDLTIKGLQIENYDTLVKEVSRRIISFNLVNYFNPTSANLTILTDTNATTTFDISSNEKVMSFVEVNYSNDGDKEIGINVISNDQNVSYTDNFKLTGANIENYKRFSKNYTTQIVIFDVVNKWQNTTVNWTADDVSNLTYLNNNERLLVFVEKNYSAGKKQIVVSSKSSNYIDSVTDIFTLNPLSIFSFNALSGQLNSSVFEISAKNELNTPQVYSWNLNSGGNNINSNQDVNATNENVFVIVETNYSNSGVYQATAKINSSDYSDNESGVVVV